jgi:O-methyltransferase
LQPPIIHKSWFSDLSDQDVPEKIAFAFLDGDFYASIRDSLKLVRPHLQKSGYLIIDDYTREALPGVAKAVHKLLPKRTVITSHNLGIVRL